MKAIMTIVLAGMLGGCGLLDVIDAKLRQAGALPSVSMEGAGIDPLSVVAIEADGQHGVGVVVDDGLVFAPYHVVKRAGHIRVKFMGHYRGTYHKEVEGRLVYRNVVADQCLIAVDTETPHRARLGDPVEGEAVCITLQGGSVNRFGQCVRYPTIRKVRIDSMGYRSQRPTRHGDSGGPILQAGMVVGLVRGPTRMVSTKSAKRWTEMVRTSVTVCSR
jgi:hypothetical protein